MKSPKPATQPMTEPSMEGPPMAVPLSPPPSPPGVPWSPVREKSVAERVQMMFLVVALGLLAISIAIAYFSANSIVSIWFERQWVPVARLGLALVVGSVSAWAVIRLTRKRSA